MLVLSRKVSEQVVVPQCELTVTVLDIMGGRVRLGFTAPPIGSPAQGSPAALSDRGSPRN